MFTTPHSTAPLTANDDDVYVISPAGYVLRWFAASDPLGRKMRSMPPADGTRVVKGLELKRMIAEGKIRV